jgi:subtilisin family serine protease
MAKNGTSDAAKKGREFHRAGEAAKGRRPLPPGVGVISDPSPGRRYLFRSDEFLCFASDLAAGLGARIAPIADRTFSARTFQPAVAPGLTGEKLEAFQLRSAEQEELASAALKAAGLVKYKVDRSKLASVLDGDAQMPEIVEFARTGAGQGNGQIFQCWPNHLITCQDYPEWGPGAEVETLQGGFVPPQNPGNAGAGVTVAVIDTGVRRDHMWLDEKTESRGVIDGELLDINNDTVRDFEAGHGTFIAGIIRQMAPGAKIVVRGAVHANGCVEDSVVAGTILGLLNEGVKFDILNLSLGGYTHRDEGNGLPATTWALEELRRRRPRTVVVACAGNDNRSDPFYPAALSTVIGVGALDAKGERADFSNYGPWVNAWALGVDVVSCFVGNDLNLLGGGGSGGTEGASWSGTSFAAPRVAGALAAAMSPA